MRGCVRNLLVGLVVSNGLGCGPVVMLGDDGDGDTASDADDDATSNATNPAGTTLPPSGTATTPMSTTAMPTSTTAMPPDDDTTGPGVSFLDGFDTPTGIPECDLWQQDCPSGEKCMPWANDGGNSWNSTRCSPIAEDPGVPGDPCEVEGNALSGIDTCDLGVICWNVDPVTNTGTCVALCMGDETNPTCADPNTTCQIASDPIFLCVPTCNPIEQDCPEGQGCYEFGDAFTCAPDASGDMGAAGDECDFFNSCDPGLLCTMPEDVPGCVGAAGCCTHFCEVGAPMPPCLPGQACLPYFEEGVAPPGSELFGMCQAP